MSVEGEEGVVCLLEDTALTQSRACGRNPARDAVLSGRRMASDGEAVVEIVVVIVGVKFRSGGGDHDDLALIDESMTGDRSPMRR